MPHQPVGLAGVPTACGPTGAEAQRDLLYRNEGNGHHYLVLALEGTRSNRDGIGARVKVQAGELLQYAEVASGYSFGNSSSLEQEFGLGSRDKVERIEVAWPSGQVDVYRDIDADQHLVLREGAAR